MTEYFASLATLDKVFFVCAAVGGVIFGLRTIMMFMGGDADGMDGGGDMDFDGGGDMHSAESASDASFHVLTVQGLTVFFLMFGLVGLACHLSLGLHGFISANVAVLAGVVAMWLIAWIMASMAALQSDGTLDMRLAVGERGTVYLRIPAEGLGKAQVNVNGRMRVVNAMSKGEVEIKTSAQVVVVDVVNDTLVVETASV